MTVYSGIGRCARVVCTAGFVSSAAAPASDFGQLIIFITHPAVANRFPCSYLYTAHPIGDMKAVHISKEGRELVHRPVPEPAAGEVLIRSTFASSLSFPDETTAMSNLADR